MGLRRQLAGIAMIRRRQGFGETHSRRAFAGTLRVAPLLCFTSFIVFTLFMPVQSDGQEIPALTGPVTDLANVIDPSTEATLDGRIRALESATGDTIVVLTVPSFEPFGSIEAFALKVVEKTGIGSRGKDNGALVVMAVKERKVRIEVGYGLEEFITDGFAGDTIRQQMLPAFRQGQYGAGLLAGASHLIQRVAERRGVTLAELPDTARGEPPRFQISPQTVVIGVIVLILIINSIKRRGPPSAFGGRRRWPGQPWSGWNSGLGGFGGRGWGGGFGGGGGGGGFGGFGGGRSGGGGASGGW